jgi:Ca-activated chloride channel family protein
MSGESIRQAKAAVNEALDQLQIEDQFNLIFFNDRSWSVFPQAKPANANNVARAKRALRNQSASGGTRMSEAFQLALPLPQTQEWLRQVVFITDGAVGNTDQLLAQIKGALGTSRLFIVGIGAAPNSYFMRRASEVGRGTYAYIGQLTQVEQKMVSLFEKINKPALTEIELLLDVSVDALLPTKIPDIYLNEMALLLFQSQSAPTELLIKGLQGDAPVYFQQALETEADVSGISVEWARRKIKDLQAQILETSTDRKAALIDELSAIALKHNQISRYTSLVAVDVTPIRAGATLAFDQIRSNLPKGWQLKHQGTQTLALAQTSNGLAWMTHVGLLWLLVALALGVFSCNARRHLRSRNGA